MKLFEVKYFLFALLFCCQLSYSQVVYKEVKAKIEVEKIENILFIRGTAENLKTVYKSISYKLTVFKKNKLNSNSSKNAQDGRVILDPQQKVTLSKTQINESKDDQIIILLIIYDENNAIVGKDRIEIGIDDESKVGETKPKDGLEMMGIVSNDTKTKLGNDFYELFYKEYTKLKLNSSKIVAVQEELTFGRTTKIMVLVDGEVINEFISRPDEDYLKYMAETVSSDVFKYFKNIEKQNKLIMRY
ncbi:CsgE family curli-type amyloid fiber assembly protein [Flavobacterium praedii]|uniref:CsgE family curli-type amyloid fiber assembly protein n=1 Tax=Flavobacterium praedii TaxID=3002900 RepID=UPI0024820C58|nr:CsgE family curli-type amyloid fiber assembly protein [Flavobacterium praedii]